jgi:hypothetical protein
MTGIDPGPHRDLSYNQREETRQICPSIEGLFLLKSICSPSIIWQVANRYSYHPKLGEAGIAYPFESTVWMDKSLE